MIIKEISTCEVFVDGEYIGDANVVITDSHGSFYGYQYDDGEVEKLQDNGDYVYVDGFGVEIQ